jgi:hypothetical protein
MLYFNLFKKTGSVCLDIIQLLCPAKFLRILRNRHWVLPRLLVGEFSHKPVLQPMRFCQRYLPGKFEYMKRTVRKFAV